MRVVNIPPVPGSRNKATDFVSEDTEISWRFMRFRLKLLTVEMILGRSFFLQLNRLVKCHYMSF